MLSRLSSDSVKELKALLNAQIYDGYNGIVQSGPFKGMFVPKKVVWDDQSMSAKILGCYEEELHPAIEREIKRLAFKDAPRIVNVGCAEGYYAVGLARRLPHATVLVVDTNEESIDVAMEAATANGVQLWPATSKDLANADLIVMDCEGAEINYLNLKAQPSLKDATIIVEIHPQDQQDTESILKQRFAATHVIERMWEGPRDPNKYPDLDGKWSHERWLAVSETRPCVMSWFVMRPHVKAVRECGGCNMCCKLERIDALKKPRYKMCGVCEIGVGCKIYDERPQVCRDFTCLWLTDPEMPEEFRPDKIGAYAAGDYSNEVVRVITDTSSQSELPMVNYLREKGVHVLWMYHNAMQFISAKDKSPPETVHLDWKL